MTDPTPYPSQIQPEPGRFEFWRDSHPGQRPPNPLIPAWLKSTYDEWDAFEREFPAPKRKHEAVR